MNGIKTENWHTTEMRRVSRLSVDALWYTMRDCEAAIRANPDNPKCGQYADTAHYCGMELRKRGETGHPRMDGVTES
jgi:hypothetical protein